MALSNWDTLAIDTAGNPCDGSIRGEEGSSVEVYKNWLYVNDPRMHYEKSQYTRCVIAEIMEGCITLSDFTIHATRGPQQSVIGFIKAHGKEGKDDKYMFCIGAYGYSDPTCVICKAMGINPDDYDDIMTSWGYCQEKRTVQIYAIKNEEVVFNKKIPVEPQFEAEFIGITTDTLRFALDWLQKEAGGKYDSTKEWVQKVIRAHKTRFNQGDMFFSDHFAEETPTTRIGEAKPTILSEILSHIPPETEQE